MAETLIFDGNVWTPIGGIAPVQLWSHSATSGVSADSITIDTQNYSWFLVEFAANTVDAPSNRRSIVLARINTTIIGTVAYNAYIYHRSVTINDGSVTFSAGTRISGTAQADSNNYCVPTMIWGIG